jgi:CRISPR-associated protein Cas4
MISVSDLSSYEYCKRKLFLNKNLGLMEIPRASTIKGKLVHELYRRITESEKDIVLKIKNADKQHLIDTHKEEFNRILKKLIEEKRDLLEKNNLNSEEISEHLEKVLKYEIDLRAENLLENIEIHKVFGEALWNVLSPKILSEQNISSPELGLRGRVDTIKEYDAELIPVEMKTGTAPKEGIWPGHRIQLSAYMNILQDIREKTVKKGIVFYIDSNSRREVSMNPFLKDELRRKVHNVTVMLNGKLPGFTENKNKCRACSLKDVCYDEEKVYLLLKECSLKAHKKG